MEFGIEIFKKASGYFLAVCPDLDLYCYGKNENEAETRLKKVIDFYLASLDEMGIALSEVIEQKEDLPAIPVQVEALPLSSYNSTAAVH